MPKNTSNYELKQKRLSQNIKQSIDRLETLAEEMEETVFYFPVRKGHGSTFWTHYYNNTMAVKRRRLMTKYRSVKSRATIPGLLRIESMALLLSIEASRKKQRTGMETKAKGARPWGRSDFACGPWDC